jgi:phosphoribosylanthranilate isomerase
MIAGVRVKICGLTSLVDVDLADGIGADYLGFILHPASPRCVRLEQFAAMAPRLPTARKTVAVLVEPADEVLAAARDAGFSAFQIHFRPETPPARLGAWSGLVGPDRLWLAPRLPPGSGIDPAWLPLARTFLVDTYRSDGFGGSGRTGDWEAFARFRAAHPGHTWILAGGLSPENIAAARRASGARVLDVNSGVESAPGIKDPAKLRALALALREPPQPSV